MKQNPFWVNLTGIQREYIMKASTIQNTLVNTIVLADIMPESRFNTAIKKSVLGNTLANEAMETLSEVMEITQPFSYVIAGGVYRDSLLGGEVSDIDVFVYNESQESFKEIYDTLSSLTQTPVDVTKREEYGPNFISVRVGDINLVSKHEFGPNGGTEILESFSASCSKIGLDVNGYTGDVDVLYNPKGMMDLLFYKKIEFTFSFENNGGVRSYVDKIRNKPWAKGYTFTYKGLKWDHTYLNTGEDFNDYLMNEHYSYIFIEVVGLFATDREMLKFQMEYDTALSALDEYGASFNIHSYNIEHWIEFFFRGIHKLTIPEQLAWLDERGAGVEVILSDRSIRSIRSIQDQSLGVWSGLEASIYRETKAYLGWDCIFVNNELSHKDAYDLYSQGKKRKVYLESTSIEVYLSTFGLGNKVLGFSDHFGGLFGFGGCPVPKIEKVRRFMERFPVKARYIQRTTSYHNLLGGIAWASIFDMHYVHLAENIFNHPQLAHEFKGEIPMKYKAQVAKSEAMCSWIFEQSLEVKWNKRTAKECVLEALRVAYPLAKAEDIFASPALVAVFEYISKNPSEDVVHNFPEVDLESGTLQLSLLDKKDPINLYIGEYTSCCQKLGGFGNSVCQEGWNDTESVNYVFRSSTSGAIVAHMWVWRDINNNLVIDSIEGKSFVSAVDASFLVRDFTEICNQKGIEVMLSLTGYGLTKDVVVESKVEEFVVCANSKTRYGYKDAVIGEAIHKL